MNPSDCSMAEREDLSATKKVEYGVGGDAWFHIEIDVPIHHDRPAAEAKVKKLAKVAASLGLSVSTNYEDPTT